MGSSPPDSTELDREKTSGYADPIAASRGSILEESHAVEVHDLWLFAGCVLGACGEVTERVADDAVVSIDAATDGSSESDASRSCIDGDGQAIEPTSGTCFMVFRTIRTRAEAQTTCAERGATLASAKTNAENIRITNLIGAVEAFLGGNDTANEGRFLWSDGSEVTFTNWRTNAPPQIDEPNNGNGQLEEDCLVIQGQLAGVWDDKPCDSSQVTTAGTYQFVCERR